VEARTSARMSTSLPLPSSPHCMPHATPKARRGEGAQTARARWGASRFRWRRVHGAKGERKGKGHLKAQHDLGELQLCHGPAEMESGQSWSA
jgi:hypothetical protein